MVATLLLFVGGGLGPPLLGLLLGIALIGAGSARPPDRPPGTVRRELGRRWRQLLALAVSSFLALVPGVALLRWWTGADNACFRRCSSGSRSPAWFSPWWPH